MGISPLNYACGTVTTPPNERWVATCIPTEAQTEFARNLLSVFARAPLTAFDSVVTLNKILKWMDGHAVPDSEFPKLDDAHLAWIKTGHEAVKAAFHATPGRVIMTQFAEGSAAQCIMKAITWSGATLVGVDVHIPTKHGPLEVPYLLLNTEGVIYPCDVPVLREGTAMRARSHSQAMLQLMCEHGDIWAMGQFHSWGRISRDATAQWQSPTWGACRDWDGIDLHAPLGVWTPQNSEMMKPAPVWVGANYVVRAPVMLSVAMQHSPFPGTGALPQFTFGYVHDQFDAALQRKMNARLKFAGKLRELMVLGRTKVWLERLREAVDERRALVHILKLEHLHPVDDEGEPLTLLNKLKKITSPSDVASMADGLGLVCPAAAFKNAAAEAQLNRLRSQVIRERIADSEALKAMQCEFRTVKYTVGVRTCPDGLSDDQQVEHAWAQATGPDAPLGPKRLSSGYLALLKRKYPDKFKAKAGFVFCHRIKRRRRTPWGYKDASSGTVDLEVSTAYGAASKTALKKQLKRRRDEEQLLDATPVLSLDDVCVDRAANGDPMLGGTSDGWWQ